MMAATFIGYSGLAGEAQPGQPIPPTRLRDRVCTVRNGVGYRYSTHTVSGADPSPRRQSDVTSSINCERWLTRFPQLALVHEYQQVLANNELETCAVNTVTGWLLWEF